MNTQITIAAIQLVASVLFLITAFMQGSLYSVGIWSAGTMLGALLLASQIWP